MSKVTHLYYFLGLPLPRTTNQVAWNNANLFSHSFVWRPEVWNEGFHQAGFCWSPRKNAVHASLAAAAGGGQSLRCLVCQRIVSPAPATCIWRELRPVPLRSPRHRVWFHSNPGWPFLAWFHRQRPRFWTRSHPTGTSTHTSGGHDSTCNIVLSNGSRWREWHLRDGRLFLKDFSLPLAWRTHLSLLAPRGLFCAAGLLKNFTSLK